MVEKEQIKGKDLELLKKIFENSDKTSISTPKYQSNRNFKKKGTMKSKIVKVQAKSRRAPEKISRNDNEKKLLASRENIDGQIIKIRASNMKRIKGKKSLIKEIYSISERLLPILQENNMLLKELVLFFKSIDNKLNELTESPIRIKIIE